MAMKKKALLELAADLRSSAKDISGGDFGTSPVRLAHSVGLIAREIEVAANKLPDENKASASALKAAIESRVPFTDAADFIALVHAIEKNVDF
jgi:hypothetical protein